MSRIMICKLFFLMGYFIGVVNSQENPEDLLEKSEKKLAELNSFTTEDVENGINNSKIITKSYALKLPDGFTLYRNESTTISPRGRKSFNIIITNAEGTWNLFLKTKKAVRHDFLKANALLQNERSRNADFQGKKWTYQLSDEIYLENKTYKIIQKMSNDYEKYLKKSGIFDKDEIVLHEIFIDKKNLAVVKRTAFLDEGVVLYSIKSNHFIENVPLERALFEIPKDFRKHYAKTANDISELFVENLISK